MKNEDSWGHVTSLLMDIAEKPRKLITDPYARRALSKGMTLKDYFKAMDVVDDCIIQQGAGAEPQALKELKIIQQLEKMNIYGKSVCQLLVHLIEGKLKQDKKEIRNERFSVLMTLGYVLLEISQDFDRWKEDMIYHCGEEVHSDVDIIYQMVSSWPKHEMFNSFIFKGKNWHNPSNQ